MSMKLMSIYIRLQTFRMPLVGQPGLCTTIDIVHMHPHTVNTRFSHSVHIANYHHHRRHHGASKHHTATILRPFFRDHLGEPVPEENFWTSWCKGRLTEADTLTIRLGTTPSGLTSAHLHHPPYFYRPDALPAAQPTVSKH